MSMHAYVKDAQSGAGNCVCGAAERHVRHPHEFVRAWRQEPKGSETRCTCSRPLSDPIHRTEQGEAENR